MVLLYIICVYICNIDTDTGTLGTLDTVPNVSINNIPVKYSII